ncbi:MAG: hypothetical protein H7Z13_02220 [Ferruginibacter sp.]|nr:hypothetical protein [Ferruginibacter sp.]
MKSLQKIIAVFLALIFINQFSAAQTTPSKKPPAKNRIPTTSVINQPTDIAVPSQCPCSFPPISFERDNPKLTDRAKSILKASAETVKQNVGSVIIVTASAISTKSGQINCQRRLDQIRVYLSEVQGLRFDRIIVNCELVEVLNDTSSILLRCEK